MNEKELRKLAQSWREYANGHYCQTYNKSMADGLRKAADELDSALKKSAQQKPMNARVGKKRRASGRRKQLLYTERGERIELARDTVQKLSEDA